MNKRSITFVVVSIMLSIHIHTTDAQAAPPVFIDGEETTRSIAENTGSGVDIGSAVSATDVDSDVLTYTLSGPDAASFSIASTSGQLTTKAALNYETKNTYSVTVSVSDDSDDSDDTDSDSIAVTIRVTDANDAPKFSGDSAARSIAENTAAGIDIGNAVSATDEDGDALTYSLMSGGNASLFSIVSTTGQLRTSAPLNYETVKRYSVTVNVSDNKGGTDSISITINIRNVNEAPVFSEGDSTTRSIAENTASSVDIGTPVAATDEDDDTLEYSLGGADAASFRIASTSGQLKTRAALDHETRDTYSVIVGVDDDNGGTDSISVTIRVTNVNEAPAFSGDSAARSIAENTASGVNIGNAVSATDEDGDALRYSLAGTNAAAFSIVSTSGQLKTRAALDYETKTSYSVTVNVSDGKGGSDSIPVTISVTDVNEAPVFSDGDDATRFIAENTVPSVDIGPPVEATDEDGDTLTYTLSGTDEMLFNIASTTGQLTTVLAFDHETKNTYSVTVSVSDNNGGSDTISVTINIINVNEAPEFDDGGSTIRSIPENTAAGIDIGNAVSATDEDGDALTYSLAGTNAASFSIDVNTGQLKTSVPLDHEAKNTYSLRVDVSDSKGGTDSISVTISITNVNEAPVFSEGDSTTRSIPENTGADQPIGTPVAATDVDGNTLTYTLGGADVSSFSIVSTTGQLQTSVALDHEINDTYSVTVSVSDGSGSDSIAVTIHITNTNETPVFTEGDGTTRSIAENTAAGIDIGNAVSATDGDADALLYSLGGTDESSFGIVSTSGQLRTRAALDHETKDSYSVSVNVSDGRGGSDSIPVTISVTDVNEAPVFSEGDDATRFIAENTVPSVDIGPPVEATDEDGDTLAYSLSGTDASSFSIVSTSGQLQTSEALDYETKAFYSVAVNASDNEGGSATIAVTIRVTNTNEAPVFIEEDSTTRAIAENTASGVNIGNAVLATDEDGDSLTYNLGGTDAAAFSIVSTTGQLQTSVPLDHETEDTYSVTVNVSDSAGGSDSITVTITVTDANDAAMFASETTFRTIPENTASGVNIGNAVAATDQDGDTLTYTLGGIDAVSFSIEESTGQLKTLAPLNYEEKINYRVTVEVKDNRGGADLITVTITVTDENDAPVFASETTTLAIEENAPENQRIGAPVSATDEDGDTLTYHLNGPDAAAFSLDGSTGQLRTFEPLDHEIKNSYMVTVRVDDGKGGSGSITVTINITDVIVVVFADSDLAEAVRRALRIHREDPILESQLATLTKLPAARRHIFDLGGLEGATALTDLDLSGNTIVNLTPLRNLRGLTHLDLADNQLKNISVLSSLMALEDLDLAENRIENISVLSRLVTLKHLNLADNQITDVSELPALNRLETLDLRDNNVVDVIPLSKMEHLKQLYLRGNENLKYLKLLVKLKNTAGTSIDITLPRPVTFRDDNLVSALKPPLNELIENTDLQIGPEDSIFPEDMKLLTTFSAADKSIVNLTGLETAPNLTSLTLSDNQIVSLSPLSKLVELTSLDLSDNEIRSISSLSRLTLLTSLNLSNNQISSVSPLSKLELLETLDLADNEIVSLSSLSRLTGLTTLNLSNNRIRDVLPLQGLSNLRTLMLAGNTDLTDEKASVLYKLRQGGTTITGVTLPPVADIVVFNNVDLEAAVRSALRLPRGYPILITGEKRIDTLTRLTATRKEIADLTGLEKATGLERLDLGDNAIETLTPLRTLTELTILDLADNQIETLTPLQTLTKLTNLDLADNQIEDVSALSGLSSLQTLDLRNNKVGDVAPLMDLTNLKQIYLRGNEETLINLEWLGALPNLRSDIKLPDVVGILDTNLDSVVRTTLGITDTLPISKELLESLETLDAPNRNISDLTGCEYMTGLTSLDLRNNRIIDVSPLSKLYALETLMLDGNPIQDTSVLRELERRGTDIDITIYRYPSWDVNQDGDVDETDVFLITAVITGESPDVNGDGTINTEDRTAADANKDGTVNTDDLLLVFENFDRSVNLAAPLLSAESVGLDWALLEGIDSDGLRVQLQILRVENDGSLKYQQAIAFLQAVLVALQPNQTLLLANYPNPFNPETWIPYQLARSSNVWITIYDTRGAVVRRLELGYRPEGYYRVRGRAAHWEGRNNVGERVASGLYFYQLETDNVSLLRKMVILK